MFNNNLKLITHFIQTKIEQSDQREMKIQAFKIPQAAIILKINPDAQVTKDACHSIGIEPSIFEAQNIKTFESFANPHITEQIQQLKFEHYAKRLIQSAKDVLKELKERERQIRKNKQISQIDTLQDGSVLGKTMKTSILQDQTEDLERLYSKTVQHLRSSHNNPQLINTNSIISQFSRIRTPQLGAVSASAFYSDNNMNNNAQRVQTSLNESKPEKYLSMNYIDSQQDLKTKKVMNLMEKEIGKYNFIKQKKQKEAKTLLSQEEKKILMIEEFQKKEYLAMKKSELEKKKKEQEKQQRKQQAKEKYLQIKQQEQKIIELQKQERQKMLAKLQKLKERQKEEQQLKEQKITEKKQLEQQKKKKLEMARLEQFERDRLKELELQEKINYKLELSEKNYQENIMFKKYQCRSKEEQKFNNFIKHKEIQDCVKQEKEQKLISQLLMQDAFSKQQQEQINKQKKKMKEDNSKQQENFKNIQQDLEKKLKKRINEYQNRILRISQNLAVKKEKEALQREIQQEQRRLKEMDKLENYQRNRRIDKYKLSSLLDKEQQIQEKLQMMRTQENFLKLMRNEVAKQAKIEEQRIYSGIVQVSDILNVLQQQNSPNNLSQYEKQKVKKILNPIIDQVQSKLLEDKMENKKEGNEFTKDIKPN